MSNNSTTTTLSSNSNNDEMVSQIIDIVLIALLLCLIFLCCCLFFLLFRKKTRKNQQENDMKTTDQISVPVMENNMLFNEPKNGHASTHQSSIISGSNVPRTLRDDPSDPLIDSDEDENFDTLASLPVIPNSRRHNKQVSAQSSIALSTPIIPGHAKQVSAQSTVLTSALNTPSPGHKKQISAQSINSSVLNTPVAPRHDKQISAQSVDGLYKRDTLASVKTIYKLEGKNDSNNGNTVEILSAMEMLRNGEQSNLTLLSKQNTVLSDISIPIENSGTMVQHKYNTVDKYIENVEDKYKQKDKAYPEATNTPKNDKNITTTAFTKQYMNKSEEKKAYPMSVTKGYKNTNDTNTTKHTKTNNSTGNTNSNKINFNNNFNMQRNRPYSMPNGPIYTNNGNNNKNNKNNDKAYPVYNTNDTRNRTKSMKTGSV